MSETPGARAIESEPGPLLRLEQVSVGFESEVVLRELSLELPRRGLTAVMGPAGVGKSTLLRTLGRWNESHPSFWTHGRVWLDGRELMGDLGQAEARARVALLAQKARLFTATVLENAIAVVAEGRSLSFAEKRELARDVLAPWGLWEELAPRLDEQVTALSLARQRLVCLARLVSGGAQCVLADEPLRDIAREERQDLARVFRRLSQSRFVMLVTHDQHEAALLADAVCLLCAGRLVEYTPARVFFREPTTELGRAFLRSGNCWPAPARVSWSEPPADGRVGATDGVDAEPPTWAPTLEERTHRPGGFHWVIPKLLGGMHRPGLLEDEAADLAGLAQLGVRHLVSLTEEPFPPAKLGRHGITGWHVPIPDMGVPDLGEALELCRRISAWLDRGDPTVLHCKAGLGRTGTLLACTLIARGLDPVRAIHEIRLVNPRYIQSDVQFSFIDEFGRAVAKPASSG